MLNRRINKRIKVLKFALLFIFLIILMRLFQVQVLEHDKYIEKVKGMEKIVYSLTSPRGRVFDRNGVLLVDNEPVKVLRYGKLDNDSDYEKEIAFKLSEILNIDQNVIYKKMNNGYYFDLKTIKENLTDQEYALVSELDLKGVFLEIGFKRVYKTEYFNKMFGSIGSIPAEKKDYYLNNGYNLNDIVGISYIEELYDDILKGEKSKYKYTKNKYELISEGKKGNDIYLTIDIKLQEEVEKILEKEIKKAKAELNTKYYNHSYVIVSDPNNGEILAMSGKKIVDGVFYDITPDIFVTTVTAGSVVKGASHFVGYKESALSFGEVRKDFCIKIKNTEAKCSWRNLGTLNDLTALKYSSNSYQFQTAIKLGKGKYVFNKPLVLEEAALKKYREIFSLFGLGVKTGSDFFESSGYKGAKSSSGLILDFAIGQYDTYTPLQLNQYINTIANGGYRLKPLILKKYQNIDVPKEVLNEIQEKDYLERIQKGFKMVMDLDGTGANYINLKYKPAGKTGTSTGYIDTNNDNIVDVSTTSNTFVGYAPYDNPIVAFTVISPDVKPSKSYSSYKTNVNKKISYEVSKKFFEIYK